MVTYVERVTLAAARSTRRDSGFGGVAKKVASMHCGNFGKSSWPMLPASELTLAASTTYRCPRRSRNSRGTNFRRQPLHQLWTCHRRKIEPDPFRRERIRSCGLVPPRGRVKSNLVSPISVQSSSPGADSTRIDCRPPVIPGQACMVRPSWI